MALSLSPLWIGFDFSSCTYLIKFTLATCGKSVVLFDSTKFLKFSPGTPVSSSSNNGLLRDGPYWTSRESSLGS